MARTGRFGTLPGAAPNLTSTIVSLIEAYESARDRNIMSAWQSGGKFEGQKVTDQRLLKWFRERRDMYDREDPEWDYWDQQLKQTSYDIGESKTLLALAQGKMGYGGAANWYETNASRFPKNSEAWRAAMRAAAQYRKAAQESATAGREVSRSEQYQKAVERIERSQVQPSVRALALFEEMLVASGVMADQSSTGLPGLSPSSVAVGNEELQRYLNGGSRQAERFARQWRRLTGEDFDLKSVRRMMRRGKAGTDLQVQVAKRFGYQSYVSQFKDRGRQFTQQAVAIELMRRDVLDVYDEARSDMMDVLNDPSSTPEERTKARETFASVLDTIATKSASVGDNGMAGRALNEAKAYRGQTFTRVPFVGAERGQQVYGEGQRGGAEDIVWARDAQTGEEQVGTPSTDVYQTEADMAWAMAQADRYIMEGVRDGSIVRVWDQRNERVQFRPLESFAGGSPHPSEYASVPYTGEAMTVMGPDGKPEVMPAYGSTTYYEKVPVVWQIGANGSGSDGRQHSMDAASWVVDGVRFYEYAHPVTGAKVTTTVEPFKGAGQLIQDPTDQRWYDSIQSYQLTTTQDGQKAWVVTFSPMVDWALPYDEDDPESWLMSVQAGFTPAESLAQTPVYRPQALTGQPYTNRAGQREGESVDQYMQRRRREYDQQRAVQASLEQSGNIYGATTRWETPPEDTFEAWLSRIEEMEGAEGEAERAEQEARRAEAVAEEVPVRPVDVEALKTDPKALYDAVIEASMGDSARADEARALLVLAQQKGDTYTVQDIFDAVNSQRELWNPEAVVDDLDALVADVTGGIEQGIVRATEQVQQQYPVAASGSQMMPQARDFEANPVQLPTILSDALWSPDPATAFYASSAEGRLAFLRLDPEEYIQQRIEANGWQQSPLMEMRLRQDVDALRLAGSQGVMAVDYYLNNPQASSAQIAKDVNHALALRTIANQTSYQSAVTIAKHGYYDVDGNRVQGSSMRERLLAGGMTEEAIRGQFPELYEAEGPPAPWGYQTQRRYDVLTGKTKFDVVDTGEPAQPAASLQSGDILARIRSTLVGDVAARGEAAIPKADLMSPDGAISYINDSIKRGAEAFKPKESDAIGAVQAPTVMAPSMTGTGLAISQPRLMGVPSPTASTPSSSIRYPMGRDLSNSIRPLPSSSIRYR